MNAVTHLNQARFAHAKTVTGMPSQSLRRSMPRDSVEITARRADPMPFKQGIADADFPVAQFSSCQPGNDQVSPMLAGIKC
ncbi:hypothetical protein Thiosp_02894 [Thiorhodovibrio litoralis]|nr:hypothetical protein Thiosp_02894 [Thiorhodovibrio litoralis]